MAQTTSSEEETAEGLEPQAFQPLKVVLNITQNQVIVGLQQAGADAYVERFSEVDGNNITDVTAALEEAFANAQTKWAVSPTNRKYDRPKEEKPKTSRKKSKNATKAEATAPEGAEPEDEAETPDLPVIPQTLSLF